MKTQDNKVIMIETEDEGWKFTCDNFDINIDTYLYFGIKIHIHKTKNIFISGITGKQNEDIVWHLKNIMNKIKRALISVSDKKS